MFPGFYLLGRYFGSYAILAIAGIFTACPIAIHHFKKRCSDKYADICMTFVLLFGGIGVVVGSHLLYGITNIRQWGSLFSAADFGEWWNSAQLIFGGAVFYGGLIGGLIAGFLSIRYQKLDPTVVSDCAAPSIALFHMFGPVITVRRLPSLQLIPFIIDPPSGSSQTRFCNSSIKMPLSLCHIAGTA